MSNFEEVFELTGHGIFNRVVLVTCGFVLLYVNVELLGVGYIITSATCDLKLNDSERGLISSAGFIGVVSTAIFWGYLSDRFGRRRVMLPSLLLCSLVSITSSMSATFGMFFALRLITGCLVSASSATVYAYLGELHSLSKRASAFAWCSAFIALTFVWLPSLAWMIIPKTWSFYLGGFRTVPWRLFIWTWALLGVLAAAMLVMLPESPRYLMATHKADQALLVMAKMYAWNRKGKESDFPVKTLTSTTISSGGFLLALKNMSHLVRPPLLRCVIISHLCMFMTFFLSNSLYVWMPDILNAVVPHFDKSKSICELLLLKNDTNVKKYSTTDLTERCNAEINTQIYPVGMAMGVLCGITYLSVGYLVEKFSKRGLFMFIVIMCGLMLGMAGVVPQPYVAIVLYVLGLCSGCAASILAAISVEVFPTNVRALTLCTLYMSGWLGSAIGATILSIGMHTQCKLTILCMSLSSAAVTLLMFLWPDPVKVRTEIESRGFVY